MFKGLLPSLLILFINANIFAQLPIIPCGEGFGIETRAAYGLPGNPPQVIKVTNLNASGSGSLKAAIDVAGPRIVVFEVSGTISLTNSMKIKNPYITIAGQTAPSPGITIRGATLTIITHDVLIQHLRVRVGDDPTGPDPGNRDAIQIENKSDPTYNVIIDHCSLSWAIDETLSIHHPGQHDITVSNTIISEGLYNSIHPQGKHSMGMLVATGIYDVSVINNLFAHNNGRNPKFAGASGVIVNNYNYNIAYRNTHIEKPPVQQISAVGNVYEKGPSSYGSLPAFHFDDLLEQGSEIFMNDNSCPGYGGTNCYRIDVGFNPFVSAAPVWPSLLTAKPSSQVKDHVLAHVGARPADRDVVDERVINDAKNGTGQRIDSQDDVGGWPSLAENTRPLTVPSNPHGDDDSDGYTNLEEWLHAHADTVEGTNACGLTTTAGSLDKNEGDLLVYPNPTNGMMMIDASSFHGIHADQYLMQLRDMLGRVVLTLSVNSNGIQTVDLGQLPDGMYLLSVIIGDERVMHKIVKR